MTEQQRSTTTVFIIAGAALGLCCVGSFAGMMLFGIGSPLAFVRGQTPVSVDKLAAPPVLPEAALTGAWSRGAPGITELSDRNAAAWSSLHSEGRRFVFRANHSCEMEALTPLVGTDCTTWQFVSRGNCEWSSAGEQLTVKFGPGTQLSKVCGKEFAESSLPAMTITAAVAFEDGQKRLLMIVGDQTQAYDREP